MNKRTALALNGLITGALSVILSAGWFFLVYRILTLIKAGPLEWGLFYLYIPLSLLVQYLFKRLSNRLLEFVKEEEKT